MTGSDGWRQARETVLLFSRRLQAEHLVAFTAGNISMRVPGDPSLLAVTPGSWPYDTMVATDVLIIDLAGRVVDGTLQPTSELPLHTLVHARRPDVGGIVHTHSTAGMACAAMGLTIPPILLGVVAACGGAVVTAPYARGGTAEMADLTAEALRDRSACLLRNHGVLAIGPSVEHAFNAASVLEATADAYLRALPFGPVPELPADEVERIRHEQWAPAWAAGKGTPTHRG